MSITDLERRSPDDTDEQWQQKLEARKREAERRMAKHDKEKGHALKTFS